MLTRIGNLLLASWFLMIVGLGWGERAAMPSYAIIFVAIVYIWFVAALILFLRSRIAWYCSLAGVTFAACFYLSFAATIVAECVAPNAQALHDRQMLGNSTIIFSTLILLGISVLFIAISIILMIGMIKMRKELRQL